MLFPACTTHALCTMLILGHGLSYHVHDSTLSASAKLKNLMLAINQASADGLHLRAQFIQI